jgi:hypothetical protein
MNQTRMNELHMLDERQYDALHRTQMYQARVARAYDKRVRERECQVGEFFIKAHYLLIRQYIQQANSHPIGKARPL